MKKIILFSLIIIAKNTFSQETIPSYPEILTHFFDTYAYRDDIENQLNFAKKKDGWYVQQVNQLKRNFVNKEWLYWSLKDKTYNSINGGFEKQDIKTEAQKNIETYLSGSFTYNWLGYERCRYFGYDEWAIDMITDYGNEKQLSDTLLEGLARAYTTNSSNYLWHQFGISYTGKDTLQTVLGRLQLPTATRLNKADSNIRKSIETYSKLLKQNPSYNTLIGNISLQVFNECMFGYMQMANSLQHEKAMAYINKTTLAEPYIRQAKNYLNSCYKNAILFTYGDNDTYQLWYVQEKENYRKDVAVINTSLLGVATYLNMLKTEKRVNFSGPISFFENAGSDYSYFSTSTKTKQPVEISTTDFLKNIYSGKERVKNIGLDEQEQINSIYSVKKSFIQISPAQFNKIALITTIQNKIPIAIKNYTLMNDLLMLDIINSNINLRPIYFTSNSTSYFDSCLIQQGITYRLNPIDTKAKLLSSKKEIKLIEQFVDSIYKPVTLFDVNGVKNISYDGSNVFFQLYSKIGDYYSDKKDFKTAKKWLDKAIAQLQDLTDAQITGAYYLASSLIKAKENESGKKLFEQYSDYLYRKFLKPFAAIGYLSKDNCINNLQSIKSYLEENNISSLKIDALIKRIQQN